jgi:DNA-binding MarR family transcriptional regulator
MPDDPSRLIRAAVERLVAASVRQRAAIAGTLGLMRVDLLALHHIGRRADMTPGELAQVLLLSSGGTTAAIDRLSRAGLVVRGAGTGGRRRVLLRITADGRAVTDAPLAPLIDEVAALTAELAPAERATIERFLARLADVSERHADRLVTGRPAGAAATAGVPAPVLWG